MFDTFKIVYILRCHKPVIFRFIFLCLNIVLVNNTDSGYTLFVKVISFTFPVQEGITEGHEALD